MMPCALTIAGSDSSGGAGIQADLKTFAALGVFGASALVAITAQNTTGVSAVEAVSEAMVQAQIKMVCDDLPIGAAKTGMLATRALMETVVETLAGKAFPLVVDPVMVAKSGAMLLEDDAVAALVDRLLPRAFLVTPNLPEAARLVGRPVQSLAQQEDAARALVGLGARAALVKGGHAAGDRVVDVFFDGRGMVHLEAARIQSRNTHGTGCTYSAAIAARLAKGDTLLAAVQMAHAFVHQAILRAPGLGAGHGPLNHMHAFFGPDGMPV